MGVAGVLIAYIEHPERCHALQREGTGKGGGGEGEVRLSTLQGCTWQAPGGAVCDRGGRCVEGTGGGSGLVWVQWIQSENGERWLMATVNCS